ncbi:hypothetical protein ACO2I3_04040 [Leptospira interrogans]
MVPYKKVHIEPKPKELTELYQKASIVLERVKSNGYWRLCKSKIILQKTSGLREWNEYVKQLMQEYDTVVYEDTTFRTVYLLVEKTREFSAA